jgi:ABC-type antimicrobial peptide transport system permease subunit
MNVVGLVAGVKWHTLREDSPVIYYMPYRQEDSASVTFAIRSTGDLSGLAARIPAIVASVDAGMVTSDVVPFTDIVNRTLVVERLIAHVSTAFAVFGLVIACVGLYGILAFAVVRRTREIGLRIALGARPRSVEWLFLRETVALLLAGFAVGVPAAYVVTRSVSSLLFGLEPGDPMTIAAVMVLLSVTALAASWIPARRAAAIDPMRGLREE